MKKIFKNKKVLFVLIGLLVVAVTYLGISFSEELENDVEVTPNTTLTYYLNVTYDGIDRNGVHSDDTTIANINSGYMEVTDRKRWNRTLLEILKYYINICEENNLTYFLAYGSAIGVARHQGFIPWDDDIDVIMPRPDYERFIQICQQRDMGKYEIVTPQNTPGYYLPFIKLCDKTTTLWEKRHYHCVFGMYIDIFVIDGPPLQVSSQ